MPPITAPVTALTGRGVVLFGGYASMLRTAPSDPKAPKTNGKGDSVAPKGTGDEVKKKKGKGEGDDDGEEGDDDPDEVGPDMNHYSRMALHLVLGITTASAVLYYFSLPGGGHATWDKLLEKASHITDVSLYTRFAQISFDDHTSAFVGLNPEDTRETQVAVDNLTRARGDETEPLPVTYIGSSYPERALVLLGIVAWVVPFLFTPLYVTFLSQATGTALRTALKAMSKQQGGEDKTSSAAKLFKVTKQTHVKFSDVAGMVEPKHEVTEIVDFLKNPDRYVKMGAKIPSGAMLLGPPGTGKTLLAKAVAGESGVAFIPCVGSDFVEMYVGMGALRVRKLFELAKKQEKCIIYIDEIDAIGLKRGSGSGGEKQEQEHTLNELLTQLDGFNTGHDRIIVLASSNVDQAQLDPALIRPGRFDRLVHIEAPVISERVEIFKYHLSKLRLVEDAPHATTIPADDISLDEDTSLGGGRGNNVDTRDRRGKEVPDIPSTPATKEEMTPALDVAGPLPELTPVEPALATVGPGVILTSSSEKDCKDSKPTTTTDSRPAEQSTPTSTEPSASFKTAETSTPASQTAATSGGEHAPAADSTDGQQAPVPATAAPHDLQTTDSPHTATAERDALIEQYALRMSDLCPGFVGADIANVCNEAAILAARLHAPVVSIDHLEKSIDRVLAGIEQRSRMLSPFEKNVVAHHEAGHAVAGWFLNRADPLMKVSIVPRGGKALGYAQYLPNENMQRSADDIVDSICVTLGGRVAEKIFFDHLSTGASDDLQKVTRMAYGHVTSFNRSSAYPAPGTSATAYVKPFGETTGSAIDDAAKALVDRAYQRTYDLLVKHKGDMEKLANRLLQNEVLTHADVVELLGPRPPKAPERKHV
jgi:AFG3 family protein